jgi:hypothetical protein
VGQREATGVTDGEPGDFGVLFWRAVARHAVPGGNGVEVQDDGSVPAGKRFAELAERAPLRRDHARLFLEFPDECLLARLSRLEVPPSTSHTPG